MITLIRALFAFLLSAVLTVLTFGRVELNRSGKSTAEDDVEPERSTMSQPLDEDEKSPDEAPPARE